MIFLVMKSNKYFKAVINIILILIISCDVYCYDRSNTSGFLYLKKASLAPKSHTSELNMTIQYDNLDLKNTFTREILRKLQESEGLRLPDNFNAYYTSNDKTDDNLEISPLYLYQLNQMSDLQLQLIVDEYENQTRLYHQNVRKAFLSKIYSMDELNKLVQYETIIARKAKKILESRKNEQFYKSVVNYEKSYAGTKEGRIESIIDNDSYRDEDLHKKSGQIIPFPKKINPFPNTKDIIIFKKIKDVKYDVNNSLPLLITRKNITDVLKVLTKNPNIIITNFYTPSNGVIKFGRNESKTFGKTYFYKVPNEYIGQPLVLEFKDGSPYAVYTKNFVKLYEIKSEEEFKKTFINVHKFRSDWQINIKDDIPFISMHQQAKNIFDEVNDILKENPDVIFSNYSLTSRGGLFLQKKHIWHIKRGYENQKVYLVFRKGVLDSVYSENFRKIYDQNQKLLSREQYLKVYLKTDDWKENILNGNALKVIKKNNANIFNVSHEFPNVIISDFPLRSDNTLFLNNEYIGQYKNNRLVHLEFEKGKLIKVWSEDLKTSYEIITDEREKNLLKAKVFMIQKDFNEFSFLPEYEPIIYLDQSMKDAKEILQNTIQEYEDILITDYELRSNGGLYLLGEFIFTENTKYAEKNGIKEKVYLIFKSKKLVSVKDKEFNDIPFKLNDNFENEDINETFANDKIKEKNDKELYLPRKNKVKIFFKDDSKNIKNILHENNFEGISQGSIESIKEAVRKYQNIIISDFMLRENGAFYLFDENFEGKLFWDRKDNLKYAKVHLEFKNGKLFRVFDNKLKIIFENKITSSKKSLMVYPINYDEENNLIYTNPIEEIKDTISKYDDLEKLLVKNPNVIIKGHSLNSQGRVYLGKKFFPESKGYITPDSYKGEKEKHAYEDVILVFKNGTLYQILDEEQKLIHQVKSKYEIIQNFLMIYPLSENWENSVFSDKPIEKFEKSSANIKSAVKKHKNIIVRNFILPPEGRLYLDGEEVLSDKKYANQPVMLIFKDEKLTDVYSETLNKIDSNTVKIFQRHENWKEDIKRLFSVSYNQIKKDSSKMLEELSKNNGNLIIKDFFTQSKGRVYIKDEIWSNTKYEYQYVTLEFEDYDLVGVYDENLEQIYDGTPYKAYDLSNVKPNDIKDVLVQSSVRVKYNRSNDLNLKEYIASNPNSLVSNFRLNDKGGLKLFGEDIFYGKLNYSNEKVFLEFKNGKLIRVYDKKFNLIHQTLNESINIIKTMEENGDLDKLVELFGISAASRIIFKLYNNMSYNRLMSSVLSFFQKKKNLGLWKKDDKYEVINFLNAIKTFDIYFKTVAADYFKSIKEELITASYKYFVKDPNFITILQNEYMSLDENSNIKIIIGEILKFYDQNQKKEIEGLKLPLKFYQKIGVNYILKNKNVILADEPGLGKSVTALAAAVNAYDGKGAKKVLIISPRISKKNVWVPEIKKHLKGFHNTFVLNYSYQIKSKKKLKELKDARFVIVNYDLLTDTFENTKIIKETLLKYDFDFIIMDEGHKIRNNSSFTNAVSDFSAEYKVILSGTPIVGRYSKKLYPLINWVRPDIFKNKEEFTRLVFLKDGLMVLKNLLKDVILRRKTADVMVDYPKLNVILDYVSMTSYQEKIYNQIFQNISNIHPDLRISGLHKLKLAATSPLLIKNLSLFDEDNKEYEMLLGSNDILINNETYHMRFEKDRASSIEKRDGLKILESYPIKNNEANIKGKKFIIKIKHLNHDSAKFNKVQNIIKVAEENNEKIVIFTGYVDVLRHVKKICLGNNWPVNILHGTMSETKRNESIDEFNKREGFGIMISTYQTGGESIDLSAAKRGVLIDTPWTFQERKQIFHRLYRMGINDDTTFNILTAKKTIDEYAETLSMHAEILEAILLDDSNFNAINSNIGITDKLLEIFYKKTKYQPVINQSLKQESLPPIITIVENNDMYLEYNSETCIITGNVGFSIEESFKSASMQKIFNDYDSLELLRKLIINHIENEIKIGINPKKTVLYEICKTVIPYFSEIDYDSNILNEIKAGSHILLNLLQNPFINISELRNVCNFLSEGEFKAALLFLTENNIIDFFIYMKIFPIDFQINDKEEKYLKKNFKKNITMPFFFKDYSSKIIYKDDDRIKEITSYDVNKKYKSHIELTKEQKIDLAKEALKGNLSAENVLIGCYLETLKVLAKKANNYLKAYNPMAKKLDIYDELLSFANSALISRLRGYIKNWGFVNTEPDDYMLTMIFKDICKYGSSYFKDKINFTMDDAYYKDSPKKESKVDKVASDMPSAEDVYEKKELMQSFELFLINNNFSNDEIKIIIASFMHEMNSKEIYSSLNYNSNEISNALLKFKDFISEYDANDFMESLSNVTKKEITSQGALKVMGTYIDDEMLKDIMNKSRVWKKEALKLDTQKILLQVEPFSIPIKIFMKIIFLEDNELPQNVYSWNLSGDPNDKDNPLIIAVKKSLFNEGSKESEKFLHETIYHEYREDFWNKNLYKTNPDLTKKEIMRLSHILASSEQLMKYSPNSLDDLEQINELKAKAILEAKEKLLKDEMNEDLELYNILTYTSKRFIDNTHSYPLIIRDFDNDEMRELLLIDENFHKYLIENPTVFRKILNVLDYDIYSKTSIDEIKYFIADYFFNSFIEKNTNPFMERTDLINQISKFISDFKENNFYIGSVSLGTLNELWINIAANFLMKKNDSKSYPKITILNTAA